MFPLINLLYFTLKLWRGSRGGFIFQASLGPPLLIESIQQQPTLCYFIILPIWHGRMKNCVETTCQWCHSSAHQHCSYFPETHPRAFLCYLLNFYGFQCLQCLQNDVFLVWEVGRFLARLRTDCDENPSDQCP